MTGGRAGPAAVAVLVPVKDFQLAKGRLGGAVAEPERVRIARRMAETVLSAAADLPVYVACDDGEVAAWAEAHGAVALTGVPAGLNPAVTDAVARLAAAGVERVVVAHADLPRARDLTVVAHGSGVTLVPDRHHDGTNVLSVPSDAGFRFRYGPGSFRQHHDEAVRLGLPVRVHLDPDLAWDVDVPDDLAAIRP